MQTPNKYFITGSSGFIGHALSKHLLKLGYEVIGLDNHNDYYDVNLKKKRNQNLKKFKNFSFIEGDIQNLNFLEKSLKNSSPSVVINLAAQAGVRYASRNPNAYIQSNIVGFHNVLTACKNVKISNIIFASSSSVYGNSKKIPFHENDNTDEPISLYAASKKSNELMAFNHAHNFNAKVIGLRFFTVYGEYGRPDMAYFSFSEKIKNNEPIIIYNKGEMARDMTYVGDIINGICGAIGYLEIMEDGNCEIFNLGNENPVPLFKLLKIIEDHFQKKAKITFKQLETEVNKTFADISKSKTLLSFNPNTDIDKGMKFFFDWFDKYYD